MRQKKILGGSLAVRCHQNQVVECHLRCRALNTMTHLGMPDAYTICACKQAGIKQAGIK